MFSGRGETLALVMCDEGGNKGEEDEGGSCRRIRKFQVEHRLDEVGNCE